MLSNQDQSATTLSDAEIVERVLGGDTDSYRLIVRRYNRRLYRVTRAILQDEHETEDVVQETLVQAYTHLTQFAGRSPFSTWLTRIAIHEAWRRMRHRQKECDIDAAATPSRKDYRVTHTPEDDLLTSEARTVLEQAIDALPETLRTLFVMRSLEEMSITEIAKCLEITEEAAKMRLLRARLALRRTLYDRAGVTGSKSFQFLGERCDRVTMTVLTRIGQASGTTN
jgi:RNA polymerase sigma-70 factor (ECF subfamily)